jgi:hypothetical protein
MKSVARKVFSWLVAASIPVAYGACGGSNDGATSATPGTDGAPGPMEGGGPLADAAREAACPTLPAETGCTRYHFIASGKSCGSSCTTFECDCPERDFPVAIGGCSPQGCLVGGDCVAICANFHDALECTQEIYGVANSDGGGPSGRAVGKDCVADSDCTTQRCSAPACGIGKCVNGDLGDACSVDDDCKGHYCNADHVCSEWTVDWAHAISKAGADDTAQVAVADAQNRVFVAGMGVGPGAAQNTASGIFFVRYSATGVEEAAKGFATTPDRAASANDMVATSDGFVVVGVLDKGSVDFGRGALTTTNRGFFVAKFDAAFNCTWSSVYASDTGFADALAVTVDSQGRIVVVGAFSGKVNFGDASRTAAGTKDAFVLTLSSGGATPVSKVFGASDQQAAFSRVVVDSAGDAYASGTFKGTIDFGSGNESSGGGTGAVLVKVATNLTPSWAVQTTAATTASFRGLGISGGNISVFGDFERAAKFETYNLVSPDPDGYGPDWFFGSVAAAQGTVSAPEVVKLPDGSRFDSAGIRSAAWLAAGRAALGTVDLRDSITDRGCGKPTFDSSVSKYHWVASIADIDAKGCRRQRNLVGSPTLFSVTVSPKPTPKGGVLATGYFITEARVGTETFKSSSRAALVLQLAP